MRKVLVSWIGHTDLRAPEESEAVGVGPVAQALIALSATETNWLTGNTINVDGAEDITVL